MRKEKLLPKRVEMDFEDGLVEEVTAHAGVALLVETGRRTGVLETADRVMPGKKNPKGLSQRQMGDFLRFAQDRLFVVLSAWGGECLEDFEKLRQDHGPCAMLGYELPPPSTARAWLERWHDQPMLSQMSLGRPW